MAAADVVVYEAALKEGWTDDKLEVQFLKNDALLEMLGTRSPDELFGEYALTAVHTGRAGGFTMVPSTGSRELNEADSQKTAQAKWKLKRAWKAIELDTAVIKQTGSKSVSVANTVNMEVEGAVSDVRKQITRQLFLDQTGLICKTKENNSTKTLELETSGEYGLGVEACRQGWLVEGQQIDIGTTANEVAIADGVTITEVVDSDTAPKIAISGSNVSTTTSHYVSIKNGRSATTSYDINGLRNMASKTASLGEISPTNEPGWVASFVDTTGGAITRQRVIAARRKVRQRSDTPDVAITSLKQVEALENEVYPQARWQGADGLNTGDGESIMIGSLKVQGHQDCPDGDFTYATKANLSLIRDEKPYWATEKYGPGILQYIPKTTFVYGALEWFLEFYTNKRNVLGQFRTLA
jgi:hypothetical protein